jgi:hypothetical protein
MATAQASLEARQGSRPAIASAWMDSYGWPHDGCHATELCRWVDQRSRFLFTLVCVSGHEAESMTYDQIDDPISVNRELAKDLSQNGYGLKTAPLAWHRNA